MNRLVAAVALATTTAIASPSLALDLSGQPAQSLGDEASAQVWQSPERDFAQVLDVQHRTNRAHRRASSPDEAYGAYGAYRNPYDAYGAYGGHRATDPDPRIRDYLQFDPPLRGSQ